MARALARLILRPLTLVEVYGGWSVGRYGVDPTYWPKVARRAARRLGLKLDKSWANLSDRRVPDLPGPDMAALVGELVAWQA